LLWSHVARTVFVGSMISDSNSGSYYGRSRDF